MKKEYFTIPNLMGYFRLILIPVYLMVYIHADGMKDYAIAAGILMLAAFMGRLLFYVFRFCRIFLTGK